MDLTRTRARLIVLLLLVCMIPDVLFANAGVGFFYSSLLHIILLNPLLGAIEAFFIRRIFKIPVRYSMIILANFVSSIVGTILFIIGGMGMEGAVPLLFIGLFVVTFFTEWPIYILAPKKTGQDRPRVKPVHVFAAQTVTYALLVPFYLWTYDTGRIDPTDEMTYNLHNLGAHAYQYRIRPKSMMGGEGSYEGYIIPEKMKVGYVSRYNASVYEDSIVFLAVPDDTMMKAMRGVVDKDGRVKVENGMSF